MLFMESNPSVLPTAVFEEAWTFVDREYSFFEFKGVDWDSIHDVYSPMVNHDLDDEELFDVSVLQYRFLNKMWSSGKLVVY